MTLHVKTYSSPIPNVSIIDDAAFDNYGRFALGPVAAKHAMQTLHHSGHSDIALRFVTKYDRDIAKQVLSECYGCHVGSDYTHWPVPPSSIASSAL